MPNVKELLAQVDEPILDGCTMWFDGIWKHCCDAHDIAWYEGQDFFSSNFDLAMCVAETGRPVMSFIMFVGVTLFGGIWFKNRTIKNTNDDK